MKDNIKIKLFKRKKILKEISEDLENLDNISGLKEIVKNKKNCQLQFKNESKENLDKFFPLKNEEDQKNGIISRI